MPVEQLQPVFLVTGSSRGIGLSLVRALVQSPDLQGAAVLMTSRDMARGEEALQELRAELGKEKGARVELHQLDITDEASVDLLARRVREEHGGLDVLVNNAGIAFTVASKEPFGEQARMTVETNFHGTRRVSRALFPLLRPGARVVAVTSNCGHLSKISGREPEAAALRSRLGDPDLTEEELVEMVSLFVTHALNGEHVANGWPDSAYKVSKVAVSALARIQQRELEEGRPGEDIVVNHAHPGWCSTTMTGGKGHWSPDRGAKSLLYSATLPKDTQVKGQYIWEDSTVTSWTEELVNLFY